MTIFGKPSCHLNRAIGVTGSPRFSDVLRWPGYIAGIVGEEVVFRRGTLPPYPHTQRIKQRCQRAQYSVFECPLNEMDINKSRGFSYTRGLANTITFNDPIVAMANPEIEVSANRQLSELVKQAAAGNKIITLAAHGQSKAVLLSLEAFEYLVGGRAYRQPQLLPLDEFHQQFHQALVEAGYDSREKIINLVQEVKQELAAEREQGRVKYQRKGADDSPSHGASGSF